MDYGKHVILIGLVLALVAVQVTGECIQRVFISNQLADDDLSDYAVIYQNDNLSRHWIKDVNNSEGSFNINCNVTYTVYIPARPDLIEKNPENSSWVDYVFYGGLGFLAVLIFVIIIIIGGRYAWKK